MNKTLQIKCWILVIAMLSYIIERWFSAGHKPQDELLEQARQIVVELKEEI